MGHFILVSLLHHSEVLGASGPFKSKSGKPCLEIPRMLGIEVYTV